MTELSDYKRCVEAPAIRSYEATIRCQRARIAALEKALEPFAKWASWYDGTLAGGNAIRIAARGEIGEPPSDVTVADLRHARALLNPTPTEER